MSLYEDMKARGVRMDWYDKNKSRAGGSTEIPLDDQECSTGSIYVMDSAGKLWTLDSSGRLHKIVRETGKRLPRDVYVCVHKKVAYDGWLEAVTHDKCKAAA